MNPAASAATAPRAESRPKTADSAGQVKGGNDRKQMARTLQMLRRLRKKPINWAVVPSCNDFDGAHTMGNWSMAGP